MHYGVKGMKWGFKLPSKVESTPKADTYSVGGENGTIDTPQEFIDAFVNNLYRDGLQPLIDLLSNKPQSNSDKTNIKKYIDNSQSQLTAKTLMKDVSKKDISKGRKIFDSIVNNPINIGSKFNGGKPIISFGVRDFIKKPLNKLADKYLDK